MRDFLPPFPSFGLRELRFDGMVVGRRIRAERRPGSDHTLVDRYARNDGVPDGCRPAGSSRHAERLCHRVPAEVVSRCDMAPGAAECEPAFLRKSHVKSDRMAACHPRRPWRSRRSRVTQPQTTSTVSIRESATSARCWSPEPKGSPCLLKSALLALLAIFAGCASVQNTPQQEYVWEMGKICDGRSNTWYLDKVDPDGRYTVRGATNSIGGPNIPYFDCMKEQFRTHPFLDWANAQKREASLPPVPVGSIAAVAAAPLGPVMAPIWQVGDEWQYAWKSPSGSWTYVWSVDRIETLDGVPHYVIKEGTREIVQRVSDLAASLERANGVVVTRYIPSRLSYPWPLTVGKSWDESYQQDSPADHTTRSFNRVYSVEAEEIVTVPAGAFRSLKVTWRNRNSKTVIYEMWYAPEVKQPVKIREVLSNGIRERELIAFKLKPVSSTSAVLTGTSDIPRAGTGNESIPLDTPDPKYQEYFRQIRERIKSTWVYPYEASSRGLAGEVQIEFGIAKNGELEFIKRGRSSGVELLDDSAMRAVQGASPFPPVPDTVSNGGLPIHGIFRYKLLAPSGGTNDLR